MCATPETRHILKSAARALAIIRVVYWSGQGKRLAEVSAETGIDKASALRLLSTLVAEGIIRRDPATGGYGPDMRAWMHLIPAIQPGLRLILALREELDALTHTAGLSSALVLPMPDGRTAAAVMWSSARTPVYYDPTRVPVVLPLHASAPGKCLLAALRPAELRAYLSLPLESVTEQTITSPARLRRELAHARRLGYATHCGEITPGVSAVAVLLHAPDRAIFGSIGLAVPGELSPERIAGLLPALHQAKARISRLLTYEAWGEFVRTGEGSDSPLPSPWDTPDPGFGDGPMPMVRTVSRLIRLMAAVFRQPEGVSLGDLARKRQLDKTTAWRLLNTLVAADVILQDGPGGLYRVSPRFWLRYAEIMRAATSLTRLVGGVLAELAELTGATAVLALPDREISRAAICQFALPRTPMAFHPEYSPFAPLHTTATGKAYLAAQSRLAVESYIQRGLASLTGDSIASRAGLLRELDAVRKAGYALSRGEMAPGIGACAVPVTDAAGSVVASLAVVPMLTTLTDGNIKRWVPLLRKAAHVLSPLLVGDWRRQLSPPDRTDVA